MEILPVSSLGKLRLLETYIFYDRPVLFSCMNLTDNLFLGVLTEEVRDYETWLLVGLSRERFYQIRSGGIDLHDAFRLCENGIAHLLQINKSDYSLKSDQSIPTVELTDHQLPEKSEFLNLNTETLPRFDLNPQIKAEQTKREHLFLHLDFFDSFRTEAPAALLGNILSTLQETLNAIGQSIIGNPTERGTLPTDVRRKAELQVVGLSAGSFQIELASTNYVDLFNESDAGKILFEFLILTNLSVNPEELKDQLTHLQIRAASKYLSFLQSLNAKVKHTSFTFASPKKENNENSNLSAEQVKKAIEAIEKTEFQKPEEIGFTGILIGANIEKNTYEVKVIGERESGKESFIGKISDDALSEVVGATLGGQYSIKLRKTTSLKPLTGDIDMKYELISLKPKV